MEHQKVNLFVVGAMKAGTTFFVELLSQHPEIYVPPIKEPHYFVENLPKSLYEPSRFFDIDTYFEKQFPEPLHITKIEKATHYKMLYSFANKEKYLVDASTAYLHSPGVAKRIHSYNPNAKIIIMLRDPLKRAFSHYRMDLGLGRTKASFQDEIDKELEAHKVGTLPWHSYLNMSFYDKNVESFKDLFKNILVLNFEDVVAKDEKILKKISHFLTIDTFVMSNDTPKNKTRTVRFQKLFYLLKKTGVKDYFSALFSASVRQKVFKMISKDEKEPIVLSESTVRELNSIFNKESRNY